MHVFWFPLRFHFPLSVAFNRNRAISQTTASFLSIRRTLCPLGEVWWRLMLKQNSLIYHTSRKKLARTALSVGTVVLYIKRNAACFIDRSDSNHLHFSLVSLWLNDGWQHVSHKGLCGNITLTSLIVCPRTEVEGAVCSGLWWRSQWAPGCQRTKLWHCGAAQGEDPDQLQK